MKNGSEDAKRCAIDAFNEHKDFYHPIARAMIEKDLQIVNNQSEE